MIRDSTSSMTAAADEHGVAAVEFAIVLPVLLLFVFGIVELGEAEFERALVADAARQAARSFALHNDADAAITVGIDGAQSLQLTADDFVIEPTVEAGGCTAGANAVVTVTYQYRAISGLVATPIPLVARAVFACEA